MGLATCWSQVAADLLLLFYFVFESTQLAFQLHQERTQMEDGKPTSVWLEGTPAMENEMTWNGKRIHMSPNKRDTEQNTLQETRCMDEEHTRKTTIGFLILFFPGNRICLFVCLYILVYFSMYLMYASYNCLIH